MTLPAARTRFTPEKYLQLEACAEIKHEYYAGEILAMPERTYAHSRVGSNLIRFLGNRLAGSPCFVLDSNMRVGLARDDRYVYPDATIVCGEPQFDPRDRNQTTIINPKAAIEILSAGTEAYDRGAKFTAYRDLETLEAYILVSQDRPLVETFMRRPDGSWLFSAFAGLEATANIPPIHIELPLSEVYNGLRLQSEEGPIGSDNPQAPSQP